MPSAHRRYAAWTPERFQRWAATIGPHTEGLVVAILTSRRHPEQGFRTCLGLFKLYRGVDGTHVVAPGWMLHIEKDCDSVLERFDAGSRWERHLLGFYRHAA